MQTYEKRPVNASSKGAELQQSSPLSTGGGSLTDGASRLDLPDAMRAKMENAFGADLSGVKFYQSEKVAEGGANAVTMGNTVAFAPGKFDMSSQSGQALLGHELSHVVSQQRGEVRGSGLLNDYALEARADREGALAAAGQSVYSGPVTPLSASSAASMAGPMQCKKNDGNLSRFKPEHHQTLRNARKNKIQFTEDLLKKARKKNHSDDFKKSLYNERITDSPDPDDIRVDDYTIKTIKNRLHKLKKGSVEDFTRDYDYELADYMQDDEKLRYDGDLSNFKPEYHSEIRKEKHYDVEMLKKRLRVNPDNGINEHLLTDITNSSTAKYANERRDRFLNYMTDEAKRNNERAPTIREIEPMSDDSIDEDERNLEFLMGLRDDNERETMRNDEAKNPNSNLLSGHIDELILNVDDAESIRSDEIEPMSDDEDEIEPIRNDEDEGRFIQYDDNDSYFNKSFDEDERNLELLMELRDDLADDT